MLSINIKLYVLARGESWCACGIILDGFASIFILYESVALGARGSDHER